MKELVLASASPRRRALMQRYGYSFSVCPADIDESVAADIAPALYVRQLAMRKACETARILAGSAAPSPQGVYVIGADTVVCLKDEIIGKPKSSAHARQILSRLSGRSHAVYTGVCLVDTKTGAAAARSVCSMVRFRKLSRQQIRRYVRSGEPMGKAGAYAIQGAGRALVKGVHGSLTNVIGLPMEMLDGFLAEFDAEVQHRS